MKPTTTEEITEAITRLKSSERGHAALIDWLELVADKRGSLDNGNFEALATLTRALTLPVDAREGVVRACRTGSPVPKIQIVTFG